MLWQVAYLLASRATRSYSRLWHDVWEVISAKRERA